MPCVTCSRHTPCAVANQLFRWWWRAGRRGCRLCLLRLAAVTLEGPRRSEFAKSMTDHVFRHEHLQVRLAVVNHEGQAHKLRHDRARPRPGLDRLFRAALLRSLHLLEHLE